MFDRNTSALKVLIAVVALGVLGGGLFAGIAAADDGMLLDDSVEVSDDVESVYVDVIGSDDFDGADPVDVEITLTGMNDSDDDLNGTELDTETVTVEEGETAAYDYELVDSDSDDFDTIAVTAEVVEGDEDMITEIDFGTLERVGGAGGGLDSLGSVGGIPIVLIVVVGGLVLWSRKD